MASSIGSESDRLCLRLGEARITFEGPKTLLSTLRFAYRDFVSAEERAVPNSQHRVTWVGDKVVIRDEDGVLTPDANAEGTMSWLDWCVASHLLGHDHAADAVLHAAAVSLGEERPRTVILVGPSGAGKSTLTAALLAHGATLLSDEFVPIEPVGFRPVSFPRAFCLKHRPRTKVGIDTTMEESEHGWWLHPTRRLTPGERGGRVASILFLNREAGIETAVLRPLGASRALLLMLAQAPMLSDFPSRTFETLASLAERTPSHELSYSEADDGADLLLRRFGS